MTATTVLGRADLEGRLRPRDDDRRRDPVIALVGRPNTGKSTFFAVASGRYAETGNVPGTTVSAASRQVTIDGRRCLVVDLPGTHSITETMEGQPPFWELLAACRPDAVLVVLDAGDLARHLPLALACRDLGLPIAVAANLADEAAAHGIDLDTGRLAQLLDAPVRLTVGRDGRGVAAAMRDACLLATRRVEDRLAGRPYPGFLPPYPADVLRRVASLGRRIGGPEGGEGLPASLLAAVASHALSPTGAAAIVHAEIVEPERWRVAQRWAALVERGRDVRLPCADRIARHLTAPWPGLPLFVLATVVALGATMIVGTWLATALSAAWGTWVSPPLTWAVHAVVPNGAIATAILWALDSGLLAMLAVGIPFVLCFYLILAALEDSGYLATTAVLSDRAFRALGLPGRAAIPLLAATGCNVPAIYATRVLDARRERVLASFLIVLTPCSARSAVVIAALAPFAGPAVALAAFGVIAAIAVGAGLAANRLVPSHAAPLLLELPPLRLPVPRLVARKAWFRFRSFVTAAAPVMLIGSLLLGLAYETGAIGAVQDAAAPLTTGLLGLPPVAGIALVLAFLRKELALQLLVVLAVAQYGSTGADLGTFMSQGQLFVFAIVTAVSVPCVATLAALADEFGWRSAASVTAATLGTGLLAGATVARLVGVA